MKRNHKLVYWYIIQFQKIYRNLYNGSNLTKKQQNLYYILEEYDFYVPKKWKCYNEKNNTRC